MTHLNARVGTNDADDFFDVVNKAIEDQFLVAGDTLVMDNARIHSAAEIIDALAYLLESNGIYHRFLPTYSPEVRYFQLV